MSIYSLSTNYGEMAYIMEEADEEEIEEIQ
jgi:hypothetical protein